MLNLNSFYKIFINLFNNLKKLNHRYKVQKLKTVRIKKFFWVSIIFWFALIALSLFIQIDYIKENTKKYAYTTLKLAIENNYLLRQRVAHKCGVYVLVNEDNQPNPYLNFIPDRDIETQDGKKLTLMNPAYVSRQIFEMLNQKQLITGHLTSLNPINPLNSADDFEAKALKEFQNKNTSEVFALDKKDSIEFYRLIIPFVTEKGCLKCHAHQGFKIGDIRGGISVSIPSSFIQNFETGRIWRIHLFHLIIWLVGNVIIIISFISLNRSIKENEKISNELLVSKERLNSIFQSSGAAFIVTDLNGNILQYNNTALELFQIDNDYFQKINFFNLVLPEYQEKLKDSLKEIIEENKESIRFETQCKKNNNHKRIWIDLSITTFKDSIEKTQFLLFTCINITKRMTAEEELMKLKQRFELILNTAGEGIIGLDKNLNHMFVNKEALNMLGYTQEELLGDNPLKSWRIKDKYSRPINIENCEILRSLNQGLSVHILEDLFWCKDGSPLQVEFRCSPIITNGEVQGAVITFSDISERLKTRQAMINLINELEESNIRIEADLYQKNSLYEKLKQSEEDLKKSNEAKTKFISILAHDIKNPLGSFKNLTKLMRDDYDDFSDEERKEIINKIYDSSDAIYELLENLLLWSKAQTGRITFSPENINLWSVVDKVFNLIKLSAELKKIELTNNVDSKLIVFADLSMLYTIIRNLVTNAIKFTPENGKVNVFNSENEYSHIISVQDTGIGILDTDINKLFKLDSNFRQLGTNNERGSGLGLILCKEFIEYHNGKIWVLSTFGKGSTFSFSLPKVSS